MSRVPFAPLASKVWKENLGQNRNAWYTFFWNLLLPSYIGNLKFEYLDFGL